MNNHPAVYLVWAARQDLCAMRYFPWEIKKTLYSWGSQTSWLIIGCSVKGVVPTVYISARWFVAWCPQTARSGRDMPGGTGCLQLKQIRTDRQTGYCTLSKPGILGTLWPSNGRSFHFLRSLKHEQTHTHTRTHTCRECAKFHRAIKAIRDRWERQLSGGEPHASGLEAITRCHNNTQRRLCPLCYLLTRFPAEG